MDFKLDLTQSSRAITVIHNALERLSFLSTILPKNMAGSASVSQIGEEISTIIQDQRALEKRYEKLIEQKRELKAAGNKTRVTEVNSEIQSLGTKLRESMKNICTSLRDAPDLSDLHSIISEQLLMLINLLEHTLEDLRSGHYEALGIFVQNDEVLRKKVAAVADQEARTIKEEDERKTTMLEEQAKYNRGVETRQAKITELKDELRASKLNYALTLRYARKEMAANNEATSTNYTFQQNSMNEEVERLKREIELESLTHQQILAVMKSDVLKLEEKSQWLKERAQQDEPARIEELKQLQELRRAQKEELQYFSKKYAQQLEDFKVQQAEMNNKISTLRNSTTRSIVRREAANQLNSLLPYLNTIVAHQNSELEAKKKDTKKKK